MTYKRSILEGMTDYTGVSLEDILSHFCDWLKNTSKTIELLESYASKVEENGALLENPEEVLSFVNFFINLFIRYKNDFETLVKEMQEGVLEAHIEIVKQLYKSSELEENHTIRFKNDWVYKSLPHEEMRPLLDDIYANTRGLLVDYRDLSNVIPRLKTFIRPSTKPEEVLTDFLLKPSMFGVGVDLNRLLAKVKDKWKIWK